MRSAFRPCRGPGEDGEPERVSRRERRPDAPRCQFGKTAAGLDAAPREYLVPGMKESGRSRVLPMETTPMPFDLPPAPDLEEQEWIRRCRAGSRRAYEPLVRRYAARAEAIARRRVGDPEEARDLAQEAFVRAFHAMPRFRPGHPFLPWFLVILNHVCVSYLRCRRPLSSFPEEREPATDGGMGDIGSRLDLERGLDELSPAHRKVLVMKHVEGFAHHEIAERLGIPEGTAMSRLHAASRRLAGLLGRRRTPEGGSR